MHVDSNNFDFYNKFSIFGSFGMHELSSSLAMKTYKIY